MKQILALLLIGFALALATLREIQKRWFNFWSIRHWWSRC